MVSRFELRFIINEV